MSFSNKPWDEFWSDILNGYDHFKNEIKEGYENSDVMITKVGSYPGIQLMDDNQRADVFKVESKKHQKSYNACVWLMERRISSNVTQHFGLSEDHILMQLQLELLPEGEIGYDKVIKSITVDKENLTESREINEYLDGKGESQQNQNRGKKPVFYDLLGSDYIVPTLFKYHITKWCETSNQ